MPLTLSALLERGPLTNAQVRTILSDVLHALADIHGRGIIHRDVKPQAILLESPDGPAYLSDFGTAWHPDLSAASEPASAKILDIGTGPYRAPEVLFGDKAYGPPVDMWAVGCMLAECVRRPPRPLFESRAVHEDGNQLGLILSIFKTIGTPTRETWPEAASFRTPPFDIYRVFDGQPWEEILSEVDEGWRDMVTALVRYDSKRMTAEQVRTRPLGRCLISLIKIANRAAGVGVFSIERRFGYVICEVRQVIGTMHSDPGYSPQGTKSG